MRNKKVIVVLFYSFVFSMQFCVGHIEQSRENRIGNPRVEDSRIIQSLYPGMKEKLESRNWRKNNQYNKFDEIISHLYLGGYDAFSSVDVSKGNPYDFKIIIRITNMSYHDKRLSRWYVKPCKDIKILDIGLNVDDIPKNKFLLLDRASDFEQSYKNLRVEQWFEKTFSLIDKGLIEGSNVLVHCVLGRSRSSTIIIAYLISRFDVSYEIAYEYVKACRPCIEPNSGFMELLRTYSKWLPTLD